MTDILAERDISISHREVVDCTCVVRPPAVRKRERMREGRGKRADLAAVRKTHS